MSDQRNLEGGNLLDVGPTSSRPEWEQWRSEVDQLLTAKWCIDTREAGLSDDDAMAYWRSHESPEDFVMWFVEKFDLTEVPDEYANKP